jgi:hypothetical protein
MKKLYDLAVKTGEYTDRSGQTKGRYENIGALMENDNGKFIFLKKTFNPAGVTAKDGSESIIVSMFKPREDESQQQGAAQQSAPQQSASRQQDFRNDPPF